MIEWLTLGLFCAGLTLCLVLDAPVLYALAAGLVLFLIYGRHKKFSWGELTRMALDGVKSVRNILITFMLIGVLTAFWRAAGTIPVLVVSASGLIQPGVFLLMTFLLCCGVSLLTGTSFGSAATMGVICATMGGAMGVSPVLTGGAILSGVFFGDRCSPVSTSALLTAELTGTDIFDNIRRMMRSALVPFLISCVVYGLLGLRGTAGGQRPDLRALFGREFALHWGALIPAVVIMVLSALRVRVKAAMTASIAAAVPLCLFLQNVPAPELLKMVWSGFHAADAQVGAMMNGGGIASMLRVSGIVCLSSSYSGIFRKTGLLDEAKRAVERLAHRSSLFAATLATSAVTSVIACSQSLAILLTAQLCDTLHDNRPDLALDIEDSVVVIAALVPWSIAGSVPLTAAGAPMLSMTAACYLYLLPLWRLAGSFILKKSA